MYIAIVYIGCSEKLIPLKCRPQGRLPSNPHPSPPRHGTLALMFFFFFNGKKRHDK